MMKKINNIRDNCLIIIMAKKISLILACTFEGGIGNKNGLPWNVPADLAKFKKITRHTHDKEKTNVVMMGRKTWESLSIPLPNRLNIVISSRENIIRHPDILVFPDIVSALKFCECDFIETVFIIGGAYIYNAFLENIILTNKINKIYLSVMFLKETQYEMDTFIKIDNIWEKFDLKKDTKYEKERHERLFASYIGIPKKAIKQIIF